MILLGGSTHQGEEAILAELFLRLRQRFPNLFLILVPRHFERSREVGRELETRGIKYTYRNEIVSHTQCKPGEIDCLLVNTTGELMHFYEYATVIFVGKSLLAEGGQNPIEPGALAKPMVFGPNMQNFADIVRSFMDAKGAVQVRSARELETAIGDLLADPAKRETLGNNAARVVHENLGAVEKTVEMIIEHLDQSELYVAPLKRAQL